MATKEKIREHDIALLYYMNGSSQKEIAEIIGVSQNTVSRWVADGAWREKRAAQTISRTSLTNKILGLIDNMVQNVADNPDPQAFLTVGDKLVKLSAAVERLDRKEGVATVIEVFLAFTVWLRSRMESDRSITVPILREISRLQNLYVQHKSS